MEQKEIIHSSGEYYVRPSADDGRIELSEDFLLPEHLDDAKRIIRCEGTLRPGGRYVSGGTVEYEGEMVYAVLYITDTNCIKNAVFKCKYSQSMIIPEGAEPDYSVFPEARDVECKLVNPRKMNLRCKILLNFQCAKRLDCSPVFSGESPEEDSNGCERRTCEAEYVRTLTLSKPDNRVSRDVELAETDKPVKEIISCTVDVIPAELTVLSGSARLSAKGRLRCVYLVKNDENVEYAHTEKTFPLECTIESEQLEEEFEGSVRCYVKELSLAVTKDNSGSPRVLELDFTYDVIGRLYAQGVCYPVTDMYSCDYECQLTRTNMSVPSFAGAQSMSVPFSATVDAPHAVSLLAPGATVKLRQVKRDDSEGAVYVDSDVCVSAVLRGDDGRVSALSTDIPVRIRFPHSAPATAYDASLALERAEARLGADAVEITGALRADVAGFDTQEYNVIDSVYVDHTKEREDVCALPITFYYPDEGEELWDIAKKYGSTEEIIRSANEITDDKKIGKSVLLIPKKRKRPLFSKVISN